MLILVLSYLGGVLTIFSPCVLPVVPFVFSRSDLPFRKSGLPMLVGMGLSFAAFGALSATGGNWIVHANQYGRTIALVLFTILGLTLLLPQLSERLTSPLVRLGGVLQKRAEAGSGIGSSLLLGASVGLLWAPCAGPILGLVLAGAAVGGSNSRTFLLLMIFGAGAATSLGVALFAGGKVLRSLKKGLGAEEWIKRGLGVTVLLAVVAIATGADTRVLSSLSYLNTSELEQKLVDRVNPSARSKNSDVRLAASSQNPQPLGDEGALPSFQGATAWLNSTPLTPELLKGKVVLVDFWTYSCINCLRTLPYLNAWYEKYHDQGLVIIGVHSPEFAFEKDRSNVEKAVRDLGIHYPVAIDNDQTVWNTFKNQYWPAHYFVDARGRIRAHHFGEGNYEQSEQIIRSLLQELHPHLALNAETAPEVHGSGVLAPRGLANQASISPETYVGYERQAGFSSQNSGKPESPGKIREDQPADYHSPETLALHHWGLDGSWVVGAEQASPQKSENSLSYRFFARDLHLVLGSPGNRDLRFRVTIDGHAPGTDHGSDIDENGNGVIREHRLYQLIRLNGGPAEHLFRIEFLDLKAEVFAFTFG